MRKAACMLLAVAALAGCARADRAFDRYTLAQYPVVHHAAVVRPRDAVVRAAPLDAVAGRYTGQTRLVAQTGDCPPDTGVLTVSHGWLRYSDAANGLIEGGLGAHGRVNISRGAIELDGRLAGSRFAGSVAGGRCAYELTLRRGGISTASSVGLAYAAAAANAAPTAENERPGATDALVTMTRPRLATLPKPAQSTRRFAARAVARPVVAPVMAETLRAPVPAAAPAVSVAVAPAPSSAEQAGQLLAQGRIAAARPLFERAAAAGDATAATAVGKTYDPLFLANMHVSDVEPDPALAAAWYRRAAQLGDPRASSRLSSLEAMQQQ